MWDNSWSVYGNDTGLCLFPRFFKKPCRLLPLWLHCPALRAYHSRSGSMVGRLVRENGNNARPPTEGTFIKASRHRPLARAIPRSVHFWPPQATHTRRQATHTRRPPTCRRVACRRVAWGGWPASRSHRLQVTLLRATPCRWPGKVTILSQPCLHDAQAL